MAAPTPPQVRILFVDDDDDYRAPNAELLRLDFGYEVEEASSASEALDLASQTRRPYQVALIDQVLEGPVDGIDLMQELRKKQPKLDVILLTGKRPESLTDALRAGAFRFLLKPPNLLELHQMVEMCAGMQQSRTDLELERRDRALLQTLLELSQAASQTLEQVSILEVAGTHIARLMDADNMDIGLLDRRHGQLTFPLSYDEGQREYPAPIPFSRSDKEPGLIAWVIRNRSPLLISDLRVQPPPAPGIKVGEGDEAVAWLGVPLTAGNRAIGAIVVQSPTPSRYDSTDQRILMAIANQVAQALHNARLYSELDVLNEISRRIAAIGDLGQLLDAIADEANALLDTRNLRIGLCRQGGTVVDLLVRYHEGSRIEPLRLDISQGLIGHTIRTGRPLLLRNPEEEERLIEQENLEPIGDPCRSWLSVPLLNDKVETIGAVGVQDYHWEDAFDEHDQAILSRLANHIGIAAEKARLSSRVQLSLRQHKALYEFTTHLDPELDPKRALFTFLAGVTASYGLGLNRAMLLRWKPDSEAGQEHGWLTGWIGLGNMDPELASRTWADMRQRGIDSFHSYLELPLAELMNTPVDQALRGIRIEVRRSATDPFSLALFREKPSVAYDSTLMPNAQTFLDAFEPGEFAVVPLRAGGRRLGVLVADNRFTGQPIDDECLDLLANFCDAVMALIENARLQRDVERRVDVLKGHFNIVSAMRAGFDRRAVLNQIVEALYELYQLDTCTVGLFDASGKILAFEEQDQIGLDTGFELGVSRIPSDLLSRLRESDEPLVFSDLSQAPKLRDLLVRQDLRSFVVLPVTDPHKHLRGVLTMGRCGSLTVHEEDFENLKALASQAGIALSNADLVEELLRRSAAEQLLVDTGKQITASVVEDSGDVLQEVVKGAQKLTGADCVVLYPYHRQGRQYDLERIAHIGLISGQLPVLSAGKDRTRWTSSNVVMRQGILVVDDVGTLRDRDKSVRIRRKPGRFLDREQVKSFVGISLEHGEEQRAVLFMNFRKLHAFSDEELLTIQSYAQQAAIAIALDHSMDRVSRLSASQLHAIEGLRSAGELVGRLGKPTDEVWQTILEAAAEAAGASRGRFLVVDPTTGELLTKAALNMPDAFGVDVRIVSGEARGITAWVAAKKRTVRVGDVRNSRTWKQRYVETTPSTQSEMAVPILYGRKRNLLGIIDLESDQEYAFSQDAQRLVQALAAAAAVVFENARLYSQADRRRKYLQAQLEAAKAISASLDRHTTLDRILEAAVQLTEIDGTPAHCGAIRLWEGGSSSLVLANVCPHGKVKPDMFGLGARIPLPEGVELPDGTRRIGICGRVALKRRIENVPDVSQDPDYLRASPETRSEIAVPLIAGQRLIGVLNIQHRALAAFDAEDQRALQTLAGQAVIAILNAEAYEQLEARRRELEVKKDELAASTAVAWAGILGSTAAHDILGYAGAIRNSMEEVERKVREQPIEWQIAPALADAREASQQIMEQAGQLRLEPDELMQPIDVHDLLRDRLEKWRSHYRGKDIDWNLELAAGSTSPLVSAKPLALAAALKNLVDNGVNAMRGRAIRRLTVHTHIEDQRIFIHVVDTGHGIPPEVQRRLFREQITSERGGRQGGLGLLITRLIIHASGGDIYLTETGEQGTTFTLWLPLHGPTR